MEGHGPWTDPVYLPEVFTAFETAVANCIKCSAKCMLEVVLPSGAQTMAIMAILRQTAKGVAREALKKAVPYYGYVDAVVTGYGTANCTINCAKNE